MEDDETEFKFDRTAFKASTFEEADNHYQVWKDSSFSERLKAATYLTNQVFGTTIETPLDRQIFSTRKHKNG